MVLTRMAIWRWLSSTADQQCCHGFGSPWNKMARQSFCPRQSHTLLGHQV